ncbi:membrane protein insertase YidC [bacterium]|nr:membrane protein insertase YidC [bacterium]
MEKRVVLFIIISITVFILWQHFIIAPKLEKQQKEKEKIALQKREKPKEENLPASKTELIPKAPQKEETVDSISDFDFVPQTEETLEKIINVDTPLYHAQFSSKGAVLLSFRLKEHWDIPREMDELDSSLQIEKDLNKVIKSNLREIYSESQVVADYIALISLINRIEENGSGNLPDDTKFRESLRNFIENSAGKTPKQIITELTQIKNFLSSKLILEDITERKESVRKILVEISKQKKTDPDLLKKLRIESGVEMVSPISRKINKYPFRMIDDSGKYDFQYLNFNSDSADTLYINNNTPSSKIRFVARLGKEGELVLTKVFEFYSDSYIFEMQFSIKNNSMSDVELFRLSYDWGSGITYMSGGDSKKYTYEGLISNLGGSIKQNLSGIIEASWNGIEDSFFTVVVFGMDLKFNNHRGVGIPSFEILEDGQIYKPNDIKTLKMKCYCGPKQIQYLRKSGVGLERLVDYGWFSFLAVPLLEGMKFLYRYIPNYGFVIIIITIIIRILFYPLNTKSMKSMKKMQEIQPKIKELRDKYKNDRQKMNEEVMVLYKAHNVNPMGGCLPMLVQIPILFAFFRLLPITIEFRHQPFIFWIKDLTAKDPYYITPILMGLSMIVQQKMTPTSVDPKQAQIMMFMPIVFTFLFLNFSSGLVLYWFTSNMLAIGQQYLMNRESQPVKKRTKKDRNKA